jgi:predicted amidohydrolase
MTKIACVQMDVEIGKVETNRQRIMSRIREAAGQGAQLVLFPECALTGYCFESLDEAAPFAEQADGFSARHIALACEQTKTHAIVGFIERDGSRYFNAAMIVGPGGVIATYRKIHLPFLGVDRFLTPGDRPFDVHSLPFGKVGVNICYDTSFPEAGRALKLLGAQLIALPTNWPPGAWRTPEYVVNTRANENHINFAAVNRIGVERGWEFIGRSKIVDVNGDTIAEASQDREEIIYGEVDLAAADKNRIVNVVGSYELDRLADRRPEFYGLIAQVLKESQSA